MDDNKLIEEFKKKVSLNSESQNNNTQYQYSYVDLETVISNPNEYIIPQCLPACEVLWSKNIETFMVSNHDDNYLYVLLANLSGENQNLLNHLIQQDSRYYYDSYRNTYGIRVNGIDDSASSELSSLADQLRIQDTLRFQTSEEFLASFKMTNGKMIIDEYGHIIRQENQELANVSLEEALRRTGKEQLYIAQEDRVYESMMYLHWHQRYLELTTSMVDGQTQEGYNEVASIPKPRI